MQMVLVRRGELLSYRQLPPTSTIFLILHGYRSKWGVHRSVLRISATELSDCWLHTGVVPGLFGNYSIPVAEQDEALLAKLNGFVSWAQKEHRIVLMNPWHYSDLGAPPNQKRVPNKNHARDGEYTLGAYAFPQLMTRLRQLGDQINASSWQT